MNQGHKGVWVTPLYPGKQPINTRVMKVELVPTTNIVLNWATRKRGVEDRAKPGLSTGVRREQHTPNSHDQPSSGGLAHFGVASRAPRVAVQQGLGLLPERQVGFGSGNPGYPAPAGQDLS